MAAVALGLGMVAFSAASAPTTNVQAYTVTTQTIRPTMAATLMQGVPANSLYGNRVASSVRATSNEFDAMAAAPRQSLPQTTDTLKAFGWMSTFGGAVLGMCVALWNHMSAANKEFLAAEEERRSAMASGAVALGATAMALSMPAGPALAGQRLPPLDTDPNRCERGLTGNTIGQANGVSDKALDLRLCDLNGKDMHQVSFSGALMVDGNFANSNMTEAILSKVYAPNANFKNVDFTSAVLDRGTFDGSDMSGSNFYNAVITGATFKGTNLADTNFEEALIGSQDAKELCANTSLQGESREQVGCRE